MSSKVLLAAKDLYCSEAFWQFACDLYADEGVKALCLYCQEELGLNVNVLLFCAWLKRFNKNPSKSHWQTIRQNIASSEQQLAQLRSRRKGLVRGSEHYKACLQQELKLEAQQQGFILQSIENDILPDLTEHPLVSYFQLMGCPDNPTCEALISVFSNDSQEASH